MTQQGSDADEDEAPPAPGQPPRRRQCAGASGASSRASPVHGDALEADAAAAGLAGRAFADELDAGGIEGADEPHQRIDVAANDAFARFHALDGGHRQAGKVGKLALVEPGERPRGAKLRGRNHV